MRLHGLLHSAEIVLQLLQVVMEGVSHVLINLQLLPPAGQLLHISPVHLHTAQLLLLGKKKTLY